MFDLKRLRSLVVVAEEGNLSRAASRLHLSQPALSRRIQELERNLNFSLFERVGRGIRLTGEGRGFLVQCRALLAHAEAVEERAQSFASGDSGVIRVGASPQTLERLFPDLLIRYRKEFPLVEVELIENTSRDLQRQIERGEIDFAVIPLQHDDRFESRALPSLPVLVAMARTHPLSDAAQIEVRDVVAAPILLLHDGYKSRQVFDAACRLAHLEPRIVLESGAPQTILALAAAGLGIAVVPSTVIVDDRELHIAPLAHAGTLLEVKASICWNRGRFMAPYAERFVDDLTDAAWAKLGGTQIRP